MLKFRLIASLLSSLLLFPSAFAMNYPESAAFESSMEATGQILSSPALPTLDNERLSLSPLYGTVKMEGVTQEYEVNGATTTVENHGTVKGQIAGLTLNYGTGGNLGFFAIGAWSKVNGDLSSNISSLGSTTDVRDISAENYVGAVGLTYRVVGDDKSTFALGVFGGPALMKATTSAQMYHSSGVTKVSLNPNLSAYYLGFQFVLRFGNFRINPYLNILGNPNPQCAQPEYSGDAYPVGQWNRCENGEHGIATLAVAVGSGINVGYGRFQFGLISEGGGGSASLKSTPLMFSFRASL